MEPWYKVILPRKEVREGRSFNPDEFAIALEQVVAGTAPEDYRDPVKFCRRTCFTRALREHSGMVLRRLAGKTENTAPVLSLITQFGGGKTHTLATLYHLTGSPDSVMPIKEIQGLMKHLGLSQLPKARVAVFVGNAWDPQDGRENPWIDIARQLAADAGVAVLGNAARTTPPGTESLGRLFQVTNAPVLILFDEVLNFINRHRNMAEGFYAFIQNLTVAMTGTTHGAALISLPRSQVEMTDWDLQWQERITKVVRRVAKDLIANDEAEISEVVRKRLFEDLGDQKILKKVARAYADWCFERRAQLPPEWTAVDTATTDAKARDFLQGRFEVCYPFHPATLSVFQRKWQPLQQYQQTRGTLAMLAQWISLAYREGYQHARREPLITLGSAPLDQPEFRAVILGQLGESRLAPAIETDIAGQQSHARALDADTKGALKDIHRRVGAAMLFESSGGMVDKVAHLPELRFALGEPAVDTTSIDNAALTLEKRAFFIRKVGSDGFRIHYKPTLKKVVSDRRASLDYETEVKPATLTLIKKEFERGANLPLVFFPEDSTAIPDSPRLTLVILEPEKEWRGSDLLRQELSGWIKQRGESPRLYPGALILSLCKPGRDLRDKVENWLAWKRVEREISENILGTEFDRAERTDIIARLRDAEEAAKDEVWAGYRFMVFYDNQEPDGLKPLDLGAGHASAAETLSGRVVTALKSQAMLNESVGSGYLERNWPPALKESGAWPLSSLRQSFLNGVLTRLIDPDRTLRQKIIEFAKAGDFGLASGARPEGGYLRVWYQEEIPPEEITFEADIFLLTKQRAGSLKEELQKPTIKPTGEELGKSTPSLSPDDQLSPDDFEQITTKKTIRITGTIPPEVWNRLGTKILPKLKTGSEARLGLDFSVDLDANIALGLEVELRQILADLGLTGKLTVNTESSKI